MRRKVLWTAIVAIVYVASIAQAKTDDGVPRFLNDIAPILDTNGCSTALCHGKFGGQGGFDLSLLTLDPEADYQPIVTASRGRRVNLLEPERSLFLLKPTEQVSHEGGMRFSVNSEDYLTILRWLEAGAPFSASDPRLERLEVHPDEFVLPAVGDHQQLKVIAYFTDGSMEDVTHKTVYESNDEPIAEVSEDGLVTSMRWGGTAVLARFLGQVAAAFVTIPRGGELDDYPEFTANNFIDTFVGAKLKKLNVVPSALSSDEEFIRRVYLDTIAKLPTPEELQAFVEDSDPNKRAALIDELLEKPEFIDLRTLRLGDMLRCHPRLLGGAGLDMRSATLFHEWIREGVEENKPYDQFVREIVTARGSTYEVGPAAYYRIEAAPDGRAETTAQAFLGLRLTCARCHKHPFDRWTTDDYWNFAAFSGKIATRDGKLYQERVIYYNPAGRVINQSVLGNRGEEAVPTVLGGDPVERRYQGDFVKLLADWMTSPTNPYFAKATVNRLWSNYFGRGIIHPVDDMRETTPSTVEGLLEALSDEFVRSGFDTEHTIKLILNSRTYQLSSVPNTTNELDDRFFSRFFPRPMLAQVFLDALNDVVEVREKFGQYPMGTRTVQLPLPVGRRFLSLFGMSNREVLAELEPKLEPTLPQALHIINSPYVNEKISADDNIVTRLVTSERSNEEAISDLYLKVFSRFPSEQELSEANDYIAESPSRQEGLEDLLWALVSSRAFLFIN